MRRAYSVASVIPRLIAGWPDGWRTCCTGVQTTCLLRAYASRGRHDCRCAFSFSAGPATSGARLAHGVRWQSVVRSQRPCRLPAVNSHQAEGAGGSRAPVLRSPRGQSPPPEPHEFTVAARATDARASDRNLSCRSSVLASDLLPAARGRSSRSVSRGGGVKSDRAFKPWGAATPV